ncbi:MAG: sialidase family protein, partial [Planctomycetota bacterium]
LPRPCFCQDAPGVNIFSTEIPETHVEDPAVTVLKDGTILASMTLGHKDKRDDRQTTIFASQSGGKTWSKIATIDQLDGASILPIDDQLFVTGTNSKSGAFVISKSVDQGRTWSKLQVLDSKELFCHPQPLMRHSGRYWRSLYSRESDRQLHLWILSAADESNLMDPASWQRSKTSVAIDKNILGGNREFLIHGNVLPAPDGTIKCIATCGPDFIDRAGVLSVSADGSDVFFSGPENVISMPGGRTKFTIRYDEQSKKYWTVANQQSDPYAVRNVVVLASSEDLISWKIESVVWRHFETVNHGLRCIDWDFDGDDIAVVSGLAWKKPHRTPNHLNFLRLRRFRSLDRRQDRPWLGNEVRLVHETSSLKIRGINCYLADLENGCNGYHGWRVRFADIPSNFQGWKFTKTRGGTLATIEVEAKKDQELFMSTVLKGDPIDITGWQLVDDNAFTHEGNKNTQALFSKSVKRGEKVLLPQGHWTGSFLLFPPD